MGLQLHGLWIAIMDAPNGEILWSTAYPNNATASGPAGIASNLLEPHINNASMSILRNEHTRLCFDWDDGKMKG